MEPYKKQLEESKKETLEEGVREKFAGSLYHFVKQYGPHELATIIRKTDRKLAKQVKSLL